MVELHGLFYPAVLLYILFDRKQTIRQKKIIRAIIGTEILI